MDGTYETIASVVQVFCGKKDGRVVYTDVTKKNIKIKAVLEQTVDGKYYWDYSFGNISVIETNAS